MQFASICNQLFDMGICRRLMEVRDMFCESDLDLDGSSILGVFHKLNYMRCWMPNGSNKGCGCTSSDPAL